MPSHIINSLPSTKRRAELDRTIIMEEDGRGPFQDTAATLESQRKTMGNLDNNMG
jgi:hypothetical protein